MRNEQLLIGETIRKRRELLGLLQSRLAAIADVSTRTVQLVERGKANPSLETLVKIVTPLGLTVQLLLKNIGTTEHPKE